jgi:two-component system sporulation sensor kinase B
MDLDQYKDLLLNAFIILTPLVFYPFVLRIKGRPWLQAACVYLLFIGPLVFTMSFPVRLFSTILDLRAIPLILGSLYGGLGTAVMLFLSMALYRELLGNLHLLHYLIALLPTFLLIWFMLGRFQRMQMWGKMLSVIGISFFLRTTVLSYYILAGLSVNITNVLIPSLPIITAQSILTGFCVYILEAIRRNQLMKEEMIKVERIKMVSELAASVAHEVRNPMTAVRGFVQMLGDGSLSDERRKRFVSISLEELDRAQRIISDYLALSKPEKDTVEVLNVSEELVYVTNILGSYANYQNVQIKVEVGRNIAVIGNRSKFRQALINLGKNAIEAMPDGGKVEFWGIPSDDSLVLRVQDTGTGMTEEQLRRLGTPYYSTKEKGTGLGTMLAFNIIHQMGGKIEVRSKLGEGTEYTITLPLADSHVPH